MRTFQLWDPLLVITLICSFFNFLPLLANWKFIEGNRADKEDGMETLKNSMGVIAIVTASVVTSIPMFLEVLVNARMSSVVMPLSDRIPYIALLMSLLLPDIILLFYAFPYENVTLLICVSNCRYILLTFGAMGQLRISKLPIFCSRYVTIAVFFMQISICLGIIQTT